MFTTLIAAALAAAAAPAAGAQPADPHAVHHPAGHDEGGHKAADEGKGCCDHNGSDGKMMGCCKDMAEADKAKCCAEHVDHSKHGDKK